MQFGKVSITNVIVTANSGNGGGGIQLFNGATLTADNSTISNNTVTGDGGGISAFESTTNLTNTTVSGNTAAGSGGGITTSSGGGPTPTIIINGSTFTNTGPDGVTGAEVSDIFPWQILNVTYTATSTGGANGFTPSGSGRISDTVNLPAGSTITYQATGTVSPIARGKIRNLASVTAPAGAVDPQPGNNRASDFDYVSR